MTAGIALRIIGMALCASLLAGCASREWQRAPACIAALTALEPDGHITVTAIRPLRDAGAAVGIDYRLDIVDAGGGTHSGRTIACAFDAVGHDAPTDIVAVLDRTGAELSPAHLMFLRRFYLADLDAIAEGVRRVTVPDGLDMSPVVSPFNAGYALQQVLNALPWGGIYALIGLALSMVAGITGRVHLSIGQSAIAGGYGAVLGAIGITMTGLLPFEFYPGAAVDGPAGIVLVPVALVAASFLSALIGWLTGRFVHRPMARAAPLAFLIASIGIATALEELLHVSFGGGSSWLPPILGQPMLLGGGRFPLTLTPMTGLVTLFGVAAIAWTLAVFSEGRFALMARAVADDRRAAALFGIDPQAVAVWVFTISGGLAGYAGALLALLVGSVHYGAALHLGLKGLAVALVGRLGSLRGAVLAGYALAFSETFWTAYGTRAGTELMIDCLLIAIIVLAPQRPD